MANRSLYSPSAEVDTTAPDDAIDVSNPWQNDFRRKVAMSSVMGDQGGSDPAQAVGPTVDLTQRDLLGNQIEPIKWQGGREFAQQIDPKIRAQIVSEVMGDDSLAPKAMTATFGGRNFTMTPSRTITQNAANAINARQMRQMEIDRQMKALEGQRAFELQKTQIPGQQAIEAAKLQHGFQTEDYNRAHPADVVAATNAAAIAAANRQKAREEYAAAHGGKTPEMETEESDRATAALMDLAKNDPRALATLPGLLANRPGFNTPGAQATLSAIGSPRPVAATNSADLRARAEAAAQDFVDRSGNIIRQAPTEQDTNNLLAVRDQLAKTIALEKPGVSEADAKAEATAVIDSKLRPQSGNLFGGSRIRALRQALMNGAAPTAAAPMAAPTTVTEPTLNTDPGATGNILSLLLPASRGR